MGSWASWVPEEKVVGASQTGAGRGQEKRERRNGSGAQAGSGIEQLISYLGDQIDLLYIYISAVEVKYRRGINLSRVYLD